MRIAWFTPRFHPCFGGAENYGLQMVRRFVRAGHEVDVVTSNAHDLAYYFDRNRRKVDAPAESQVDGARVLRFPVRHFPLQRYPRKLLSYVPHWKTRCRVASYMPILPGIERLRGAYDAVFGVGFPFTNFSFAALRTARRAGAPLILTPFLHLATPGDVVNRTYTQAHQKRLLAEADMVVVPTALEAAAVAGWGIPRSRILKLGMAVEHAEVSGGDRVRFRAQWGISADRVVIGHLATLDPNKGSTDLVRAVARLNASRPAPDAIRLVMAGTSTPEFDAFRAALPLGDPPWISYLGELSTTGRADFFAGIDIFSMPSRTDSFGIVFLEAWANRLPVVAAAAGGVVEVVAHEQTGLLVPFGDVARLSEALGRLVSDRVEAERFGAAGKLAVSRGFTWDDRFVTLAERVWALPKMRAAAG